MLWYVVHLYGKTSKVFLGDIDKLEGSGLISGDFAFIF